MARALRPLQEICGLEAEGLGDPADDIDAGGVDATLDGADVGAVYAGTMRQLLLREALVSPIFPHIERQDLSDVHAREGSALLSISPRSILYKTCR